ncbi:MAG TPA: nuclear transport factor 2 family protein [Luteimonas sp.]|nr:nuclear transport factor 2 family protein [Luteimonas sp.]
MPIRTLALVLLLPLATPALGFEARASGPQRADPEADAPVQHHAPARSAPPLSAAASVASPAIATWKPTTPQAEEATRQPRIAAALAAAARFDRAILARDEVVFAATFADDAVVNNPFNTIATKAMAVGNLRTGLIDYASLERSIEYAATRGAHDVVLMGEETLEPVGKARFAGRKVRRRTTEIWSDESGEWKLAIRQATIHVAE